MKSIKKLFAMGLAVMMALSIPFSVSAAELEEAPIDESRTGSLTIYKYDLSNAEKDGVWDSSYVSTGVFDQTGVNDVLGGSGAALGNGETGYGYAIKGVEFSYLSVPWCIQPEYGSGSCPVGADQHPGGREEHKHGYRGSSGMEWRGLLSVHYRAGAGRPHHDN